MGMYDTIEYEGKFYQTKNFDCIMAKYKIENDKLLIDYGHYEKVPKEELPYPDTPFIGSLRWVHEEWVDMEFHGIIEAYGDERDIFFKFTDGALVGVT